MSDDVLTQMTPAQWRDYCSARAARALDPFLGETLPLTQARAAAMLAILEQVTRVLRLQSLGYARSEAEAIVSALEAGQNLPQPAREDA